MIHKESSEYSLKQNTDFLKITFYKMVLPCMLSILSANINVFVDGILVGSRLGTDALAAINLSLPLYLLLCVAGSFFASGTAINAARAIGDNDTGKSQEYYRTGTVSSFLISILITVIGLVFRQAIVSFLCSDVQAWPYVMEYIVITLIGALPKIMIYIPFWYLRLDGRNMAVVIMMFVMSVGNVILDILFVYFGNMGVFGAGLASVIATTAACVIGFIFLFQKKSTFTFRPYIHKRLSDWKDIAAAGLPSALNNLFSTIRILMANNILMGYGGSAMVAVFSAVNGISGFGECITLGIPQAASAMLGVYSGEKDNESCSLLLKLQWLAGCVYGTVFFLCCMAGTEGIRSMYGLSESVLGPLFWLTISTLPALFCNILSGYYNMAQKTMWANGIILLRVILMTYVGLQCVLHFHWPVFSFLLFAEVATIGIWFVGTGIYHRHRPEYTRFLLMDNSPEKKGSVLNFSVDAKTQDICDASERITEFCSQNGMSSQNTLRLQLALEEIMTLIVQVNHDNRDHKLKFDLRAFSVEGTTGIRIRYAGKVFDPFRNAGKDDSMYMGITMIKKMIHKYLYQRTFGANTLQVILREEKSSE